MKTFEGYFYHAMPSVALPPGHAAVGLSGYSPDPTRPSRCAELRTHPAYDFGRNHWPMFYMGQVLPLPDGRLIVVAATELSYPYFEERGWARILVGSDEELGIYFKDWAGIKERGASHPQGRFRRDTTQPDYETLAELVRRSEG